MHISCQLSLPLTFAERVPPWVLLEHIGGDIAGASVSAKSTTPSPRAQNTRSKNRGRAKSVVKVTIDASALRGPHLS